MTLSNDECYTNTRTIRPTIEWYNYYLYAIANRPFSNNPIHDAELALSILNEIKKKSVKDPRLLPDSNTYKQVISIYAKTKSVSGAMTAQLIFDEMMSGSKSMSMESMPTTDTFNALMNCWLKCGSKRGRQRIESLLAKMVELRDSGCDSASPDIVSVNTAISAIGRSQRKDSVRKAYFILKNMETIYGVKPDATSYNLVINAYAKSRDLQGGQKADNLLKEMEFQFRNGNRGVMPNSFSYSTVIDAMSNDIRGGKLAEELLDRMHGLHQSHGGAMPDTVVYNSIMNLYAIQGDKDSIKRIQSILRFMEESLAQGNLNLKPNIISYNTLLKAFAYARDDFTQDAKTLLDRLSATNDDSNLKCVSPDAISYTTVISCYARSDVQWKAKIAQQILNEMVDSYRSGKSRNKPTVFTFNAVLNACAYTFNPKEKVDAFMVIVSTLVLLQEFTKPDHTTYGTLLKAWCNLIPKDDDRRNRIVRSVFRQCCKDGQVGNMVMQQLKYAASPELYRTLIGKDITQEIKISNLPTKWSRNVKERQGKLPRIS
jgi:PPR repeat.